MCSSARPNPTPQSTRTAFPRDPPFARTVRQSATVRGGPPCCVNVWQPDLFPPPSVVVIRPLPVVHLSARSRSVIAPASRNRGGTVSSCNLHLCRATPGPCQGFRGAPAPLRCLPPCRAADGTEGCAESVALSAAAKVLDPKRRFRYRGCKSKAASGGL